MSVLYTYIMNRQQPIKQEIENMLAYSHYKGTREYEMRSDELAHEILTKVIQRIDEIYLPFFVGGTYTELELRDLAIGVLDKVKELLK